ncbi:MAG: D-glycerate dehydrogenase, partial [Rhodospirillaceae bacterium]|nr:D-glycerate dehydrogenase [Rhodospirillaceae bacterium]
MTLNKPSVIVTRKLPEAVETRMMELFDVRLNADDTPFDREALGNALASCDVLVPTLTDTLDGDLLSASGIS